MTPDQRAERDRQRLRQEILGQLRTKLSDIPGLSDTDRARTESALTEVIESIFSEMMILRG